MEAVDGGKDKVLLVEYEDGHTRELGKKESDAGAPKTRERRTPVSFFNHCEYFRGAVGGYFFNKTCPP